MEGGPSGGGPVRSGKGLEWELEVGNKHVHDGRKRHSAEWQCKGRPYQGRIVPSGRIPRRKGSKVEESRSSSEGGPCAEEGDREGREKTVIFPELG